MNVGEQENDLNTSLELGELVIDDVSAIDSNRIISILDEMLLKLHHVSQVGETLDLERLRAATANADADCSAFVAQLQQQLALEGLLTNFVDESGRLRDHTDKQAQILVADIRHSTAALARHLLHNATASTRVGRLLGVPSEDACKFVETAAHLREIVVGSLERAKNGMLVTKEVLEDVMSKEHRETSLVKHLDDKLRRTRVQHNDTLRARGEQIESLRGQIQAAEIKASGIRERVERELEQCKDGERDAFEAQMALKTKKIEELRAQIDQKRTENRTREDVLHRRKVNAGVNVQRAIDHYDAELGVLHQQITSLKEKFDSESSRVAQLREHFRVVDLEKARQAERERVEKARRKRLELNLRLWACATLLIHKHVKRFMRKPPKKGKKKGKKTKSKK